MVTRGRTLAVLAIAACAGGAVMALEIAAGRALAPSFGSTIYVWSSVIAVTLLFLAIGYGVGGSAADRWPSPTTLGWALAAAGATGVGSFWLNRAASDELLLFDLRLGALLSAATLLALPLAFAAAATPICVRLIAASHTSVGRAAGHVYAASTVGGVIATLSAGFWALPSFGVTATFHAACALMAVPAVLVFLLCRRWRCLPPAGLLLALTIVLTGRTDPVASPGEVLMSRQSLYGSVIVAEDLGHRLLIVDGVLQTGAPLELDATGKASHLINERYHLELLPYYRPAATSALLIGLGGGLFPRVMASHGVDTVSVEIDPAVAEAAVVFFDVPGEVVIEDGRRYLRRTQECFDFIVIDAYAAELPPSHLFSAEMFELAADRLAPHGILAINLIADPGSVVPRAVSATLAGHFQYQRAYRYHPGAHTQALTLFASARALRLDSSTLARDVRDRAGFDRPVSQVLDILHARELAIDATGAPVITDDRNRIELAWHRDALSWRREMSALLPNATPHHALHPRPPAAPPRDHRPPRMAPEHPDADTSSSRRAVPQAWHVRAGTPIDTAASSTPANGRSRSRSWPPRMPADTGRRHLRRRSCLDTQRLPTGVAHQGRGSERQRDTTIAPRRVSSSSRRAPPQTWHTRAVNPLNRDAPPHRPPMPAGISTLACLKPLRRTTGVAHQGREFAQPTRTTIGPRHQRPLQHARYLP